MRKLIQLFMLAALVSAFALPALAQTQPGSGAGTATPASQDDAEAKVALYKDFTGKIKTDPPGAYKAGKEYLAKYEAKDGPDDQYIKYIKKWVAAYEKVARREELLTALKANQIDKAYGLSQAVLADYPDDLGVLYELARAGFTSATSGNEANNPSAITYTKRTIQLISSGKSFDPNKPLQEKEKNDILSNLNFALGLLQKKSAPTEAISSFVTAAQFDGAARKDPLTYYNLAELYETTEYSKLAAQFGTSCKTPEQQQTPECVEMTSKINSVVDHMIDALARAISYSKPPNPNAASFEKARAAWMESLTNYYKYRNNNDEKGINELIAGITNRPLPKPGEPVTPPLFQTPAATPPAGTTGSTTGAASTSTAAPTTGTATTAPKTTTTAPKTTTTAPASTGSKATATTTKTTPKRAH